MILDRNGEPLAVSTPVDSVWAEPARSWRGARSQWPALAQGSLDTRPARARPGRVTSSRDREFMYLKRHVTPEQAAQVKALDIAGVGTAARIPALLPARRGRPGTCSASPTSMT
ncbi:MAG: hypothetical protein MZV65_34530 [Chromatiales bacterium]|nr:hypothetical protein [Chromatiales bacterium]